MSSKRAFGTIAFGGLTPLLDTLFILLFAMLVTSETKTEAAEQEVRVTLPAVEPGTADSDEPGRVVTFEIGADSTIRLVQSDRFVVSRSGLDALMNEIVGDVLPEEVSIELRADRDARHGIAAELLQYLRLRGFTKVQLLATGYSTESDLFGGGR